MKIYKKDEIIYFEDEEEKFYSHKNNIQYVPSGNEIEFIIKDYPNTLEHPSGQRLRKRYLINDIKDIDGNVYGTTAEDVVFGINLGQDVRLQDRTTDSVFAPFNKVNNSTSLAQAIASPFHEQREIIITSAADFSVGSYIVLFDPDSERFSQFTATGVNGTTITLDSLIDFPYPSGTFVDVGITNMAVDGSVTPVVFGVRGAGTAPPGVDINYHLIRILFSCLTASSISLAEFGDIPALERGLLLRVRNGRYHNEWNIKTNQEMAGILYDFDPYTAQNPQQGQDGFESRLTYSRLGIAIDLPIGQDAELIVQDDLREISFIGAMSEGHLTTRP